MPGSAPLEAPGTRGARGIVGYAALLPTGFICQIVPSLVIVWAVRKPTRLSLFLLSISLLGVVVKRTISNWAVMLLAVSMLVSFHPGEFGAGFSC